MRSAHINSTDSERSVRRAHRALTVAVAVVSVVAGCASTSPGKAEQAARLSAPTVKHLRVLTAMSGADADNFTTAIASFTEQTGTQVEAVSAGGDFAPAASIAATSADGADVLLFPQPGLFAQQARAHKLVPVDNLSETARVAYGPALAALATVDGTLSGVWTRASVSSLIWYRRDKFAAAGYTVPTTQEELVTLVDRVAAAKGPAPFCLGLEDGSAAGWPLTDWVEDAVLQRDGTDTYGKWVRHELPFDSPEVRRAIDGVRTLALNDDHSVGHQQPVVSTPVEDAMTPLFGKNPGCLMYRMAEWVTGEFPSGTTVGDDGDIDVFPVPPFAGQPPGRLLVGGDIAAIAHDSPAARQLLAFFTTEQFAKAWASAGGYLSPLQQFDPADYPDPAIRKVARILSGASELAFDGSDLMTPEVGTGTFLCEMIDLAKGATTDEVIRRIDNGWPARTGT